MNCVVFFTLVFIINFKKSRKTTGGETSLNRPSHFPSFSAPDGREFEQQSARRGPDQEPHCEKNCSCMCHLQRPGMKLVWVRLSEKEEEDKKEGPKHSDEEMVPEEASESEDDEAELELYESVSSESDNSLNESESSSKSRFQVTLNIIEKQLRRKSDPGPEAVHHAINSLPQFLPHLNKTHSASEEESIYEATLDLFAPPRQTLEETFTVPEIKVNKSPPAIPPRMPLDKTKGRRASRRVPLSPPTGAPQMPKLPSVDLGSGERMQPVRPPPLPPARANDRRLSNLPQINKGDLGEVTPLTI